jgi:hypothetical protein
MFGVADGDIVIDGVGVFVAVGELVCVGVGGGVVPTVAV